MYMHKFVIWMQYDLLYKYVHVVSWKQYLLDYV